MNVQTISSTAKKVSIIDDGVEVARGRIYLIENDLGHGSPYAYLEDVYVVDEARGRGYGTQIVCALLEEAKKAGCYKVIGCSRYGREKVHEFYSKLGFKEWGKEFRLDL